MTSSAENASPSPPGTVYAVDFGAPGGADSFQSLVDSTPDLRIVRLPPPGISAGDSTPPLEGEFYAAHYADLISRRADSVDAILGYCAGGIHAEGAAVRLREAGVPVPALILFDTLPEGGDLVFEFRRTIGDLGWSASPARTADLDEAAERLGVVWGAEGPAAGVAFAERFAADFIEAFLVERGVAPSHRADLAATMRRRCAAWFRYVAASTGRSDQVLGPKLLCSSTDMAAMMRQAWKGSGHEVEVVASVHRELLASAACRDFVTGALTGKRS